MAVRLGRIGHRRREHEPSSVFKAKACAFSYPDTMSLVFRPIRINSSAFFSNSPAKIMTKFVPSPISASCCWLAMTNNLAAG